MSSFEETIARMKGLYTYGNDTNESKNINEHTLEHHAIGADGKSYGIIKEQNKYYIKTASKKNELIPESYEYIGGFCNRKNYEYPSYNKALKNFELKLASVNEAYDGNVNTETLDPFKREDVIVEGTDKMKNELARVRQIMHNAAMIMNEETAFKPVVGKDAEKPGKPNNDGMSPAGTAPENPSKNLKGNKPVDSTFTEEPKTPDMMKEESSYANGEPRQNTRYWDSDESTDGNPDIDWVDGSERVNEETEEWDEGLPSSAGVGEADTGHNNDPFNNSLNEEEDDFNDEEDDAFGDDFGEPEDKSTDTDFDDGLEPYLDNDEEFDDGEEPEDDEFGDEFDDEEEPNGDEDEFELELGDDEPENDEFDDEEEPDDNEFDDEEGFELGNDEPEDEFGDEYYDEPEDELDDEYGEENGNMDECGFGEDCLYESKNRRMNRIVESVIRSMLKEDELHDFGKHPGYRKKPMTLPPTGEDKNQWGEDWNDESVHSEEPFGKQIGDGDPFNNLVDNVTRDVLYQLSHGVPINKKKAD